MINIKFDGYKYKEISRKLMHTLLTASEYYHFRVRGVNQHLFISMLEGMILEAVGIKVKLSFTIDKDTGDMCIDFKDPAFLR